MGERIALFAPTYDPRDARCFLQLPGLSPTAIAGSLTLKPGARILVEHEERPVGYLNELFRMPWVDRRVWHAALVELDDDDWPRNQPVSINLTPIRETSLSDGRRIVERAVVNELSITSRPAIAPLTAPAATNQFEQASHGHSTTPTTATDTSARHTHAATPSPPRARATATATATAGYPSPASGRNTGPTAPNPEPSSA